MTKLQAIKAKKNVPVFRHSLPIQLRFKDADLLGHINNANHLTYMEIARMDYFNTKVTKTNNWLLTGLILARFTIDYIKPIMITDAIVAYTRCCRLGNKSFDLTYELRKQTGKKEELMATATSTIVCFNYEKQETIPIPSAWRKKIIAYDHP